MRLDNIVFGLGKRGVFNWLPDKVYLNIAYRARFGRSINFRSPRTFNEKLQWLKLHDRKEIYTTIVDKNDAKEYVANIIGYEYVIPTISVYDNVKDIDFDELPNQFVIKCTHDSGSVVVVKDKTTMDSKAIKRKLSMALRRNGYNFGREWPYKNVKPRIIVEKYMSNTSIDSNSTVDYKLFCFNGKPEMVLTCSDRFGRDGVKLTWFDFKWNLLPLSVIGHKTDEKLCKPKGLDKMKKLAEKLSKDIPFVRVDFYEFDGKVYFGEMTFFPVSGFVRFDPEEWDKKLGDLIVLPKKDKEAS